MRAYLPPPAQPITHYRICVHVNGVKKYVAAPNGIHLMNASSTVLALALVNDGAELFSAENISTFVGMAMTRFMPWRVTLEAVIVGK